MRLKHVPGLPESPGETKVLGVPEIYKYQLASHQYLRQLTVKSSVLTTIPEANALPEMCLQSEPFS